MSGPVHLKQFSTIYKATGLKIDDRMEVLETLLPFLEKGLKKHVSYAKDLPGFKELPIKDQLNIIKSAYSALPLLWLAKKTLPWIISRAAGLYMFHSFRIWNLSFVYAKVNIKPLKSLVIFELEFAGQDAENHLHDWRLVEFISKRHPVQICAIYSVVRLGVTCWGLVNGCQLTPFGQMLCIICWSIRLCHEIYWLIIGCEVSC